EAIKLKVQVNMDFYLKEIITQTIFIDKFYEKYKLAKYSRVDVYLEVLHLKHVLMHFDNIYKILIPQKKKGDDAFLLESYKERERQLRDFFNNYEGIKFSVFRTNSFHVKKIDKLIENFTFDYMYHEKKIAQIEKKQDDVRERRFLGDFYKSFMATLRVDDVIEANNILKESLKGKSY
ncbi:MAG: hypothetical protein KC589_04890, partial [Nanoarchaeota archaeon]|nr:hypothetical protein [Nanoarchaeota archaeon]